MTFSMPRSLFHNLLGPVGVVCHERRVQGQRESSVRPGIAHLLSAFHGPYLWLTIKVSLMVMGAQGGVWAVNFWMPTYLELVAAAGERAGMRFL
jgi:hypothetical protein